jgi:hypothetical protein
MPPTARAAGTAAAPVITWARTFPAVPAQVREARRFLAGLLDGGQAADDALICLSELASNAVVHSRTGWTVWFELPAMVQEEVALARGRVC